MGTWYTDRDTLKAALQIPASATGDHALLDAALEGVAREFDKHVGFAFYPSSGSRYYTPKEGDEVDLHRPLLAIDSLQVSTGSVGVYNTTLSTADFDLEPFNAPQEAPPQPYWEVELRATSTGYFPTGIERSVKVTGTWGYYDQRTSLNVYLSTALNATATAMEVSNSSLLHPGQTILIDSERITITRNGKSGSDTATTSGTVGIARGVNGSSGAAHSSGAGVQVYGYPIVDKAALYQAEMDYRGMAAPMGFAGGEPFGTQQLRPAAGGLHPFTLRTLRNFRAPRAR